MKELVKQILIIGTCAVVGKSLHTYTPIYFVLYATIVALYFPYRNLKILVNFLKPAVISILIAVMVNEIFNSHQFIIWTLSLFYFDYVRRKCRKQTDITLSLMPVFNVIFVNTYSSDATYQNLVIPIISDMLIGMLVSVGIIIAFDKIIVTKPALYERSEPQTEFSVTGLDRLKMLILVGGGLAFMMITSSINSTFCLVPFIVISMQPSKKEMLEEVRFRGLTQLLGCIFALVFLFIFASTMYNLLGYFLLVTILVYVFLTLSKNADITTQKVVKDTLMGAIVTIQLYVGSNDSLLNIHDITLRIVQLCLALGTVMMFCMLLSDDCSNSELKTHQKTSLPN
ncbi:DUF2955 domain-containing protein [Vibrio sp. ER1A]|uniref:DUF2955 domain-containing protein n=1 Tax=Vibrio sp. ER1A TaxID=1517681 RepID=UPI0004DD2D37|nr:DUF2955 domain-containing protein [Vibrio sp. ER1A]KFA98705.1 hypothetical protein HW45_06650 [Vibrio sp. ER1A]